MSKQYLTRTCEPLPSFSFFSSCFCCRFIPSMWPALLVDPLIHTSQLKWSLHIVVNALHFRVENCLASRGTHCTNEKKEIRDEIKPAKQSLSVPEIDKFDLQKATRQTRQGRFCTPKKSNPKQRLRVVHRKLACYVHLKLHRPLFDYVWLVHC